MIDKIKIKNFQNHKDTEIFFDKGVNLLVGISNSGKTAILRAINWVINNRPLGDSIRSHWKGDTKVMITIGETSIERVRTDKDNYYKINDNELRAFGQGVPEEVSKFFNFTETNIQKQLDAPFLLSESPSEVQRILNKISKLDVIDSCMSKIELRKRRTNQSINSKTFTLNEKKSELELYKDLPSIKELFVDIKIVDKRLDKQLNLSQTVNFILADISEIEETISDVNKQLILNDEIDKLIIKNNKLNDKIKIEIKLVEVIDYIKENKQKIEWRSKLFKYKKVVYEICDMHEKNELKIENCDKLKNIRDSIIHCNKEIFDLKDNLSEIKLEYNTLMPNVCPLCGSELGENHEV